MRALRFGKVRKLHSSVLRESKTACDQRPSWIPVAPATPRYFYKVRRLASGKTIQNQPLTSSVLNPRSRELWRQTAPEREFGPQPGAAVQSFAREGPCLLGIFPPPDEPAENILCGATGGGRGIPTRGTEAMLVPPRCRPRRLSRESRFPLAGIHIQWQTGTLAGQMAQNT